jgi:RNA polymerase sigma-70 factor (ECF subfamily)
MEGKALDLLVERASHGDEDSFEELAAAHLPGLYRAALALVGPSDARDVTQEVLVTAWRELPRLRKPESFAPWLRRILLNRCRNHYRASARRERATLRLTEEWRSETASHAGFQRLELSEALERLPLPQRTVIALHLPEGALQRLSKSGTGWTRMTRSICAWRDERSALSRHRTWIARPSTTFDPFSGRPILSRI